MASSERRDVWNISNLTLCSAPYPTANKENLKALHYWPFLREIRRWPMVSLQRASNAESVSMPYRQHEYVPRESSRMLCDDL